MKRVVSLLILALLGLSLTGCDSIFLKKGKGIIRFGCSDSDAAPGSSVPVEGSTGSTIRVEVQDGALRIFFDKNIGWVKCIVATRLTATEVWSTLLDSALGEVLVELPETLPADTYRLILQDEQGEELYMNYIYFG